MSRLLFVRSAAANDIKQARKWYDSQRDGLGSIFVESLDKILRRIANKPEQFPRVHRELRRAAVTRFPYGSFYLHDGKTIRVIGCFHGRRDPIAWKARLDEP